MGNYQNIKLYVEQQKYIIFEEAEDGSVAEIKRYTFMGEWNKIFRFIQIFTMLSLMISLIYFTIRILGSRISLDADELYEEYKENLKETIEEYGEASQHEYTRSEVHFTTWLVKLMILAVTPASILIYRSRILSLHAFLTVKQHQGLRRGVAYNRCL